MNFEFGAQFFTHLERSEFFESVRGRDPGAPSGPSPPTLHRPPAFYGSGQGAIVTGRVTVVMGKFNF
jgi:hypothetical protein